MKTKKNKDESQNDAKKKRKNVISAVFDWFLIGSMVLGPSLLTKSRPCSTKIEKNYDKIEELAPNREINTDYAHIDTQNPFMKIFSGFLYSTHAMPVWKDKINVNIAFEMSYEQKLALEYSIELLNEVNQKTYTNVPSIMLNFDKDASKFNLFDIDVVQDTETSPPYVAITETRQFPTKNGLNSIFTDIKVIPSCINDTAHPTYLSSVITHELMHAIYGLDDNYLYNNDTDSLMNEYSPHGLDFLSPNDLYLIDAVCWSKKLTDKQSQEVKDFYKYFEVRYEGSQGKPVQKYLDKMQQQELEN